MPLTGTIKEARTSNPTDYRNADGQVMVRRKITYNVHLGGLGDDPGNYSGIGHDEILSLSGLPQVNFSVHYFNGKIIPYLICRNKRLIDNPNSLRNPKVECTFESRKFGKEGGQTPQDPPADPEDLDPQLDFSVILEDKVVYTDQNGKTILTPTGNRYREPAMAPLPIPVLTITQYELGFDEDTLAARAGTVNDATWRSKNAYSWWIVDISAEATTVPVSGGGTTDCHQVVYTLQHNSLTTGWKETRALVDTHYLKDFSGTKRKLPFMDGGQRTTGWIKADGTIQPRSGGLLFDEFQLLEEINFNAFLARAEVL